ncbi:hypothetical protein [Stutzerimonas stutzeri]|uniref:hypothetical protein n=1 Tax=Stutzerimonas stutzeri TaxID=316 RepID=UPI002109AE50|nr:hypothetical protein [Stutzerimonas stutzeri]MCQ4260929.1 hypothetical protein [Stutzerimonas stutzeri]
MILLMNLFLILGTGFATFVAFGVAEGAKNKIISVCLGAAAFVLLVSVLPSANEATPSIDASASRSTKALQDKAAVAVTLRNYKEKGDSVKLECSGTTGNITCKAKK